MHIQNITQMDIKLYDQLQTPDGAVHFASTPMPHQTFSLPDFKLQLSWPHSKHLKDVASHVTVMSRTVEKENAGPL